MTSFLGEESESRETVLRFFYFFRSLLLKEKIVKTFVQPFFLDQTYIFERRLILLYILVQLNSSKLVATLYLGPMRLLWAYIEGMEGISLSFTITKSTNF